MTFCATKRTRKSSPRYESIPHHAHAAINNVGKPSCSVCDSLFLNASLLPGDAWLAMQLRSNQSSNDGGETTGPEEDEDSSVIVRQLQEFRRLVIKSQVEGMQMHAGCTAIVALRRRNTLYVANAGDSRAVLCRGGLYRL
jgi:hypothetical protein